MLLQPRILLAILRKFSSVCFGPKDNSTNLKSICLSEMFRIIQSRNIRLGIRKFIAGSLRRLVLKLKTRIMLSTYNLLKIYQIPMFKLPSHLKPIQTQL